MKILYLIDQVYLHGGIEKVLSQKANYLSDKLGFEVIIVTSNQNDNLPCYNFSNKIRFHDLNINYIQGKSYFHPQNLYKQFLHYKKLKKIIIEKNPDIIISSSYTPDTFFIPFICNKIPKIKEYHVTKFFNNGKKIKTKLINTMFSFINSKYDKVVILNEDEKKYYNNENTETIPNPTEIDEKKCNLNTKKIIAAGRITDQKNFEHFVYIWKKIPQEFKDWEVHIYGENFHKNKENIEKLILENNLENNIFFKGTVSNLKLVFLDYSIFAMTSKYETFPMVLLEALSVGLPIVSYNCPTGPNRIISNNEDGFLVDYLNVDDFSIKISKLMSDEKLRLKFGEKAKLNAEKFQIDKIMSKWVSLFNELKQNIKTF